jgi:hypothetical protein
MPVAMLSKAYVSTCLVAGDAGSNLGRVMDVRLFCSFHVVSVAAFATSRSLAQRNSVGCVCLILCDMGTSKTRRPRP